ncbi:radical SAM protein [bacterium]|nr:radical SAM protein [bacterium]
MPAEEGIKPRAVPSPAQMINAARAAASFTAGRLLKRPIVLGSPVMLMVEPTTACQLRCPHCPTGRGELSRPTGRMTLERFKTIWDSIRPAPILLQLWNQGEPFVNRETPEIITHAARSGAQVKLSTNVELLARGDLAERIVRAGLAELILSLDGTSAEAYNTYRVGGDFDHVREGIERVVAARQKLGVRHPLLTWQFLLFKHTLEEIPEARRLARQWGVDHVVFKTAQLEDLSREEGETWLPDDPALRRYDLKGDRWVLRRSDRYFCNRIFASAVVQWDGTVVPCCFDKDGRYVVGNAADDGFPAVWTGEAFQRFRRDWIEGRRPEMCDNCTEGLARLYSSPKGL